MKFKCPMTGEPCDVIDVQRIGDDDYFYRIYLESGHGSVLDVCVDLPPAAIQVNDYFAMMLIHPAELGYDEGLHRFDCPLDSACGDDCVKVIDAAAKLIRLCNDVDNTDLIRRAAAEQCCVLLNG